MPKCKSLDRLELTRRKMAGESYKQVIGKLILDDYEPIDVTVAEQHFDKCPKCGQYTLVHESGCEHCNSCGYDACAWNALE